MFLKLYALLVKNNVRNTYPDESEKETNYAEEEKREEGAGETQGLHAEGRTLILILQRNDQ